MAYILNKVPILCRSAFHKNIISSPIGIKRLKSNEHFTNRTNVSTEKKYRFKDNISDGYRLVYREHSFLNTLSVVTHYVGWIGIVTNICTMGYLIYKKFDIPLVEEKGMEGVTRIEYELMPPLTNLRRVLISFGSFAMCILLIVGSKTIPFRIYYNSMEKMYKAVFVNRIFGKKQIETFGEGTIEPIFSRKFLGDVLFNINGRIVLLDKKCFSVQSVQKQMIRKIKL